MNKLFILLVLFFISNSMFSNSLEQKEISFNMISHNFLNLKKLATDEEIMGNAGLSSSVGGIIVGAVFTSLGGLLGFTTMGIGIYIATLNVPFDTILMPLGIVLFSSAGLALLFLGIGLPLLIYNIYKSNLNKNTYNNNNEDQEGLTILKFNL